MTEVYQPRGKEGADTFSPDFGLSRRAFRRADLQWGQPLAGEWQPVLFQRGVHSEDGVARIRSDICEGASGLVLRPSGREALESLLAGHGEMLPIIGEGEDGPLWLFNCTTVVDALDWEAMRDIGGRKPFIDLDDGTDHVGLMAEPMFVTERLEDVPVFKVPRVHRLFLGPRFVDAAEAAGLQGLVFDRLWPTVEYAAD